MIATDFDREGELIGLEALRETLDANPGIVAGAAPDGELSAATLGERPPSSAPATRP